MSSKLQIYCTALMESSWLAAAVAVPLFFNISSVRMFEPDKMFVLQFLAVLCGAAWLLKWIHRRVSVPDRADKPARRAGLLERPLVIPVLALAAACTLSSIFSIMPSESWWGSYRRAQGTIAFYCYTLLFLAVLSELRSSAQLRRLQYAIILASLPVSAYPILQFIGSDPIPWTDVVYGRSSGSMGNPIFMGAYLIMVIPLTFSRLVDAVRMLRADSDKRPGYVLACCCGIALLMQLLALLCTQSRGPLMGLVAAGYLCFFIFLVLKRGPGENCRRFPVAAAGLGFIAPVLLILTARIVLKLPAAVAAVCSGGAVALIAAVYLALWRTSWGRHWLWLTWLAQTIALLLIIAAGPARILGDQINFPMVSRLTEISGGSVHARYFLWQTGYNAMSSGSPDTLPDGSRDAVHFLRPAIGYGPECIWFPVNFHALPGLVEIHSGNADRMHNETYDNLISAGFIGAVLSLLVIAAALFYSLRHLGLLSGPRQRLLFSAFIVSGSAAGILLPWLAGLPYLSGVGVQGGLLLGVFAYVSWSGCRRLRADSINNSRQIFMLCILGALTAHFIETGVGIAVAPSRTYFFLLLAVLSALASGNIEEDRPVKARASRPLPWFRSPLPPFIAIASLVALVEAWCFIVNTTAERSAAALFFTNWFSPSDGQRFGLPLPGNLILLLLTTGAGIALIYAEKPHIRLHKKSFGKIAKSYLGLMVFVWLAMGFLAAIFWAAEDPSVSSPMDISLHAEARVTLFLFGLLFFLAANSSFLAIADSKKLSAATSARSAYSRLGVLLAAVGAFLAVFYLVVRPAWADIACHIARVYDRGGNLAAAVQVYERATQLAPRAIPYFISLGLAQSRSADPDTGRWRESARSLQRAVDLNPLDFVSHNTLGSFYMQTGEQEQDLSVRNAHIQTAMASFQRAIRLAPNNRQAYNNLGRCYFLLGDYDKARSLYEESLQMYPNNAHTHMYMGEMQYRLNDLEGALKSYSRAARLDRSNIEAGRIVGVLLSLLDRPEEAIKENLRTLRNAPNDLLLLRRLSSLYFDIGDYSSGLEFARRAYEAMPEADRPGFDVFLRSLRNQPR
jgi:tetratricopeptide (TPR) repeat protein